MLLYTLFVLHLVVACPQEQQINLRCNDDIEVIQASLKSKYSDGYLCMTINIANCLQRA